MSAQAAVARVDSVLRDQGYDPRHERGFILRTRPRALGGDTTLVLVAEVTPYELTAGSAAHAVVALTGRYSVPSRRIQEALIHAGPQAPSALWARVQAVGAALSSAPRLAGVNALQRMYVLDCGRLIAKDQSRWTPGVNVGQPRELSNNCYLFQHERGTLLWDTGVPDSVAERKDGVTSPNGAIVWLRERTLVSQLESLGINPDGITYVAISHTHADHVGNVNAFPRSKILLQKLEHDLAMSATPKPLDDDRNVELLSGDRDVFGDGSLTLISTPGHTPGHQSLLVKLPKTGALILTGDLVHFQFMWDNRVVPPFNFDRAQSLASFDRVAKLLGEHRAQLWIGHDKDMTARIQRAPRYYQ
jgi:glyoxylase-like metal-dependent hydrolase (beta-lactamase superfamily II)